ncbi:MAG: hypothetical protein J3Q66DRAFT_339613 [Benniella sp.]|nr:MAG: hypothetical protein J3Q66DRAFT_339613 [Benniella sp.]
MIFNKIAIVLVIATLVVAKPHPKPTGGCPEGYKLKKWCGKNLTGICCPIKNGHGPKSAAALDLAVAGGFDFEIKTTKNKEKEAKRRQCIPYVPPTKP